MTIFASRRLIYFARFNGYLYSPTCPALKFSNLNKKRAFPLRLYYLQILLATLVGLAWSAPAPVPRPLTLVSELKTPASTAKLTPLVAPIAPIATPVIAPVSRIAYAAPVLPQVRNSKCRIRKSTPRKKRSISENHPPN